MGDQPFSIQILGNVQTCRTEAEISFPGSTEPWAVVWEEPTGWRAETIGEAPVPEALAREALQTARSRLLSYTNRRGESPPPGLSAAGLSLWLMAKNDGTSMGHPFP